MLKSPKFQISPQLIKAAANNPALRVGARGDGVKRLQEALVYVLPGLTMPNSISKHGGYDGIYGQETRNAVIQFQTAATLEPDGVAGQNTITTLDSVLPQSLGQSYLVPGIVPVLKMSGSYDCWAVSYTMMLRWKTNRHVTVRDAIREVGDEYLKLYDRRTSMPLKKFAEFLAAANLHWTPSIDYSATNWMNLVKSKGLLWVGAQRSLKDKRKHSRLIEGFITDGTDNGTELMIVDPDATGGSRYTETFPVFAAKYQGAHDAGYKQIRHY